MTAWFAPGRVEVLGKHTDYAGGRSLLMALGQGVTVTVADAPSGLVATSDAVPGEVSLSPDAALPEGHWGHYPRTAVERLERNFGPLRPARLAVSSTLPLASGMSSSSALLVATALALADHNRFFDHPRWIEDLRGPEELATYLATIENGASFRALEGRRGVGTLGGSQDHTAMVCCRPGELARYDFRGEVPAFEESLAWDPALSFVVVMSGVLAEKTGAARGRYNRSAELAREVALRWREATGRADANIGQAVASVPDAAARLTALVAADAELSRRLGQFLTESQECIPAATDALRAGDLPAFGEAVARSQRAADEGLGNQVDETRFLVESAVSAGAHAASAFGAGYGGSVWALASTADAGGFGADWLARYRRAFPQHAERSSVVVARPAGGVRRAD